MSYQSTLTVYKQLLEAKPGHALLIGSDSVAVLVDGQVCGAYQDEMGRIDLSCAYDFDKSAWNAERDCWDCDHSPAMTANAIKSPVFIPIV